jgi:hypothetical protein
LTNNTLQLVRFREARFGTWDKNDPKDAQVKWRSRLTASLDYKTPNEFAKTWLAAQTATIYAEVA